MSFESSDSPDFFSLFTTDCSQQQQKKRENKKWKDQNFNEMATRETNELKKKKMEKTNSKVG